MRAYINIRGAVRRRAQGNRRRTRRSPVQIQRQKAFQLCIIHWKTLSREQRYKWLPCSNANETHFNAYMRLNLTRVFNDLRPLATPPPGF